ncbi:glycosyltransferase [Pseudomonas monteilii]|uniref:glycosyltransferase n=1 Tax=Pseudomonas monteilii TaxID=76759 RepID=UPI00132F5EB8|nr:glycosyltransferase [Pseudomonas monteilii]
MSKVAMIVWNEFVNDARVLKEAQTLATSNYDVKVFALHTPGKTLQNEVIQEKLSVRRIARSPLWRWRKPTYNAHAREPVQKNVPEQVHVSILRLIARTWTHLGLLVNIISFRPDVIHAHDVNTLPTAWLAKLLTGAKLVYDAHEISTSREGYVQFKKTVALVEKYLIPRAAAVITTTDTRAKYLARLYKVSRPLTLQNRPRFVESVKSRILHEQLGLAEEWPIVLYQGGIQSGRGLEKLVRCAKQFEPCYVVLIGGGRLTQKLFDIRESLELQSVVHFIPTVALSELPNYTAAADIAVQPIENTCFNHFSTDSNKLFEYIIAGVPSVATNFPEIRKIINEHQAGVLIPDNDDAALVEAVNKLLGDRNLRTSLSKNAKLAAKALSWESQENLLTGLYQNILSDRQDKVA